MLKKEQQSIDSKYIKDIHRINRDWFKLTALFSFTLYLFTFFTRWNMNAFFYLFLLSGIAYVISKKKVRINIYIKWLVAFCGYVLVACFWSIASTTCFDVVRIVMKFLLLAFLITNMVESKEDAYLMLKCFCWAGISFCVYAVFFYGINYMFQAIQIVERLGEELGGINEYGFHAAITFVLCVLIGQVEKKYFYYIISALPFFIVLSSSSRKALLIVPIAIFIAIIIKRNDRYLVRTLVASGILILVFNIFMNIPGFEQISLRMDAFLETALHGTKADSSTYLRFQLIDLGRKFFMKAPIFGNGTDSFGYMAGAYFSRTYIVAHNNFMDLLASYGVIGFFLYYTAIGYVLLRTLKGFIRKIPLFDWLFFLMLVNVSLVDMAYSSYLTPIPYVLFAIVFRVVDIEKQALNEKPKEKIEDDFLFEESKYIRNKI